MIIKGKRGTHAQIWHGAGDSDDSWGDWTAEGNEGATAAAAFLPGLWAIDQPLLYQCPASVLSRALRSARPSKS